MTKKDDKKTVKEELDQEKFKELLLATLHNATVHSFLSMHALQNVDTDGELGVDFSLRDLAHAGVDETVALVEFLLNEGEDVLRKFSGKNPLKDTLDSILSDAKKEA